MLISQQDIDDVIDEVTMGQIEIEKATALKWGARALAMFQLLREKHTQRDKINTLLVGFDYYHEALEHAAMTENSSFYSALLKELQIALDHAIIKLTNR